MPATKCAVCDRKAALEALEEMPGRYTMQTDLSYTEWCYRWNRWAQKHAPAIRAALAAPTDAERWQFCDGYFDFASQELVKRDIAVRIQPPGATDPPQEHAHTFCPHCRPCRKNEELFALRRLLTELVALKDLKDAEGKTAYYEATMPIAWRKARAMLDAAPGAPYAVFCPKCDKRWSVQGYHKGSELCAECAAP